MACGVAQTLQGKHWIRGVRPTRWGNRDLVILLSHEDHRDPTSLCGDQTLPNDVVSELTSSFCFFTWRGTTPGISTTVLLLM